LGQRTIRSEVRRDRRDVSMGRGHSAPDSLEPHRHLRMPRAGPHDAAPRRSSGPPGDLPRARLGSDHRAPARPRRDGGGAPARAPCRLRARAGRARAHELLGLQHPRVLGSRRTLRDRRIRRAGRRVQDHGEGVAPGRNRGPAGRGLQPHGGRGAARSDAVAARNRQHVLLPIESGRPARVPGLHGLREQPEHAARAHPAARHGQPAVLGPADARGRLPLRLRRWFASCKR